MARVDAIARILSQALGAYLLSTARAVSDGNGELFTGAACFNTTVDLNEKPCRRPRPV